MTASLAAFRPTPDEPHPDRPVREVPGTTTGSSRTTVGVPEDPVQPGYHWVDALAGLSFDAPVAIAAPPGETNRLFVVERTGLIVVVTNLANPTRSVFLDLREGLYATYLEAGLLGLAFHPGYATNRQFFVFRTALLPGPGDTQYLADVLARFEARAETPDEADPASETRLIVQTDALDTHNGGDLQFGPDGYLYVSLGDEAPPAEQTDGDRQPLHLFFGAVLRIDVDRRAGNLEPNPHPGTVAHYLVPRDNPLVGTRAINGRAIDPSRVRTEFFAWGFRNPWRLAIDEKTGAIYVGDVGGAQFEELNRLRPGGNYGWPYREGLTNGIYWFLTPPGETFDDPLITYPHGSGLQQGNSILGGVVHRGAALPELRDRLIFGDVRSGHTWALREHADGSTDREWLCSAAGIVSFGRDPRDGEVLAAHYPSGRILSLQRTGPDPGGTPAPPVLPAKLSLTGIFSRLDTLEPAASYLAYSINAPFWSDHAEKQRWVSVPATGRGVLRDDGTLDFPAGTIWVKHFEIETARGQADRRRRLETRLLVRNAEGAYGATYRWNESGTDADLVPPEGLDETVRIQVGDQSIEQVWHYPGRAECLRCHTAATGYAAGFSLEQLNRPAVIQGQARDQLDWLTERGILPPDLPAYATAPALVDPADESRPLHTRARSYLASNCASCHRPGSLTDTTAHWDARFKSSLGETALFDGRLCLPGDPDHSRLLHVVARTAVDLTMPPLASFSTDAAAATLIRRWIAAMPLGPWTHEDLGRSVVPGAASIETNSMVLSASGAGFHDAERLPGILGRPWHGDGLFEVTLQRFESADLAGHAGLFVASSSERRRRPELSFGVNTAGVTHRFTSDRSGEGRTVTGTPLAGPIRLRAQRTGTTLTASLISISQERGVQTVSTMPGDAPWFAGLVASSGTAIQQAHAWYADWLWAEAEWSSPAASLVVPFGTPIPLSLLLHAEGVAVSQVHYFADDTPIGSASSAPFDAAWTQPVPGNHALTARVVLSDGRAFLTRPRSITILPPPTAVTFLLEDPVTRGNWIERYGRSGFMISDESMLLPDSTAVFIRGGGYRAFADAPENLSAPQALDGTGRVAGGWTGNPSLTVDIDRNTSESYRFGLYFVDWTSTDLEELTVEVSDPLTGAVLDRKEVKRFSLGVHLVWKASGPVHVRIASLQGSPVTLTAVFLDAPRAGAGQATVSAPVPDAQFVVPTSIALAAQPVREDRAPRWVEFLIDGEVVAAADQLPFTAVWQTALVGTHSLVVRGYDEVDQPQDSPPVFFHVRHTTPQVTYLGMLNGVRGNWPYRIGSEGWWVPPAHGLTSRPVSASVSVGRAYQWLDGKNGVPVSDPRAPLLLNGIREAACWTSDNEVLVNLDLADGLPHVVTLYLVDWDTNLRRQRVEWLASEVGDPLDSRSLAEFFQGTHLMYLVQGRVVLRLVSQNINAVLSGLFVDPYVPATPTFHGIGSIAAGDNGVRTTWRAARGRLFRVHYTEGIGFPWIPFPTVAASADGEFSEFDPLPPSDQPIGRFYRLEQLSDGAGPLRLPDP